jgi:hypothetical protein
VGSRSREVGSRRWEVGKRREVRGEEVLFSCRALKKIRLIVLCPADKCAANE